MIKRCYYPKTNRYSSYGGKGITVCDRWRYSFSNFLADMGPRPSKNHSIDRYPNKNGNYELSNCRWATRIEQAANTNRAIIIEYEGQQIAACLLAHIKGVNSSMFTRRLGLGWPIEKALFAPKVIKPPKKPYVSKGGTKRGKANIFSKKIQGINTQTGEKHIFYGLTEAANYAGGVKANIAMAIKRRSTYKKWKFNHIS